MPDASNSADSVTRDPAAALSLQKPSEVQKKHCLEYWKQPAIDYITDIYSGFVIQKSSRICQCCTGELFKQAYENLMPY